VSRYAPRQRKRTNVYSALPSGEKCGTSEYHLDGRIDLTLRTVLWDIGYYEIGYASTDDPSDSDQERRRKRRHVQGEGDDSDDPYEGNLDLMVEMLISPPRSRLGKHQEELFRSALHRPIRSGKSRSIHFTLKGGYKVNDFLASKSPATTAANDLSIFSWMIIVNSPLATARPVSLMLLKAFILILPPSTIAPSYGKDGNEKKTWFIRLPRGVDSNSWGADGEEGTESGRSVKSGRLCSARRAWSDEMSLPRSWADVERSMCSAVHPVDFVAERNKAFRWMGATMTRRLRSCPPAGDALISWANVVDEPCIKMEKIRVRESISAFKLFESTRVFPDAIVFRYTRRLCFGFGLSAVTYLLAPLPLRPHRSFCELRSCPRLPRLLPMQASTSAGRFHLGWKRAFVSRTWCSSTETTLTSANSTLTIMQTASYHVSWTPSVEPTLPRHTTNHTATSPQYGYSPSYVSSPGLLGHRRRRSTGAARLRTYSVLAGQTASAVSSERIGAELTGHAPSLGGNGRYIR